MDRRVFLSKIFAIQAIAMLIGMGMASWLGDRIGIVPLMITDAGFNILAALLAFALIRVTLQPDQPPADIVPVSDEFGAQEAATQ